MGGRLKFIMEKFKDTIQNHLLPNDKVHIYSLCSFPQVSSVILAVQKAIKDLLVKQRNE